MKWRWLLFAVIGLGVGGALAQQAQTPKQDQKEEPKKRQVDVTADHLTYDDRTGLAVLEGNVVIRQEDMTLTAVTVRYNADEKKAWCEGEWKIVDRHRETIKREQPKSAETAPAGEGGQPPAAGTVPAGQPSQPETQGSEMKPPETGAPGQPAAGGGAERPGNVEAQPKEGQPGAGGAEKEGQAAETKEEELDVETTLTGTKVTVDLDVKVAIVEGNVKVVRVPKPLEGAPEAGKAESATGGTAAGEQGKEEKREDGKEVRRKQATLTCDKVEYYYDEKRAVATGSVTVKQEKRTATADAAEFKEKEDLLTVTGNVVVTDEKGQRLECEKAVINTADDTVEAWGLKMIGFVEEKETKPAAEGQPTEAAPAGESGPAPAAGAAPSGPGAPPSGEGVSGAQGGPPSQ